MRTSSATWLALSLFLPAASAQACKCLATFTVCNEVAQSNMVFIGTVESIEPAFFDPWNRNSASLLPYAEITRLHDEGTPASLARLKEIYIKLFPSLSPQYLEEIRDARTHDGLREVFEGITSQGKMAHIRVKTLFVHKEDDDDDDKTADKDKKQKKADDADDNDDDDDYVGKVVTVWTDSGDCGFSFQKGETYLVYADDDEETGQLSTSICHRTTRLSDAGEDLAYLYYLKNGGDESTRLEGYVTSDPKVKLRADADPLTKSVDAPVPDVVIELASDDLSRGTRADAAGRFVFDGLKAGDYQLTVFDPRFPLTIRQLGLTTNFHAEAKSCARQILVTPKP